VRVRAGWDGINRTGQGIRLVIVHAGGTYDLRLDLYGTDEIYTFNGFGMLTGVSQITVYGIAQTAGTSGSVNLPECWVAGIS